MRRDISDLLAECLSAAEAGGAGSDRHRASNAREEATCRGLASLALELRQMPAPSPSASFRSAGYQGLMREIERRSNRCWSLRRIRRPSMTLATGAGRRLRMASAWVSVLVAVILCLGTGGAVLAAEGALPGDLLYGLKTAVEEVRLAAMPAAGDISLHARFAGRRLDEIEALVAAGRPGDVAQAAAGYETHLAQALQALVAMGDENAGARDWLAAEFDQVLSRQTAAWDSLAGQMPAQMAAQMAVQVAPVIQRAQSASTDARAAIRQLCAEPSPDETSELPALVPSALPPGDNQLPLTNVSPAQTAEPPPEPPASALPAELPLADTSSPPPASTPPPPPAEPPPADPSSPPPAEPPASMPPAPPVEPPPADAPPPAPLPGPPPHGASGS